MADYEQPKVDQSSAGEVQDRGLFDFLEKKEEEKKAEEGLVEGVEKIHIEEHGKVEEEKKEGLLEKLHHRSHSSSSSSVSWPGIILLFFLVISTVQRL